MTEVHHLCLGVAELLGSKKIDRRHFVTGREKLASVPTGGAVAASAGAGAAAAAEEAPKGSCLVHMVHKF